ncbi:uncharacterized protein [Ptychodera flava]|uniref:uncharacterized protein isoform X2 n=1 Tax=Ptychodera flava TaxID=63121 RepID=UPI003969BC40
MWRRPQAPCRWNIFSRGKPVRKDNKEFAREAEMYSRVPNAMVKTTELDQIFLEEVCRDKSRCLKPGVTLHSYISNEDDDLFIACYLIELEEDGKGIYWKRRLNRNSIQFYCERHGKPKGKLKSATETRANACSAYVTFQFIEHGGRKAALVFLKSEHHGHNIKDSSENKVNRLCPEVLSYINNLIEQGKKPSEIMVSCARWADSHGHHDYVDRRFYPTPRDIKYALECHSAKQQANNQALIIVYQSMEQRQRAKAYGQDIVFVDATYSGVTAYGFTFYCLLVRDTFGHGTPIAFFVISQENEKNIHTCFEKFKITNPEVSPRAFMVDKDYKEIHVISSLYPMSDVLLCWFHVLQAVQRWLTKSESDISGLANQDKRKAVVKYMSAMKQCTTEEAFQEMVDEMESEIPFQKCVEYLRRNWVPIGHMWAAFGRRFYHGNSETNNLIERFFLGIKYQFLHGYAN